MKDKVLEAQINERKQLIIDAGQKIKYNRQGIYGIYAAGQLVYVGKSTDMLHRVASHILAIDGIGKDAVSNKYKLLAKAKESGLRVSFDVLEYIDGTKEDLDRAEAKWIRQELPILNTQIPKLASNGYYTNKKVKNMTYEEFEKLLGTSL